jgi:hypothetical protein
MKATGNYKTIEDWSFSYLFSIDLSNSTNYGAKPHWTSFIILHIRRHSLSVFIQCSLGLSPPPFYCQPRLSPKFLSVRISPIKNTLLYCQTQLLSQVFRHKSRKTNFNSPVSTAHNYLLTAVYWSVIMECQNWSSDTVIDLIVEGRNRW